MRQLVSDPSRCIHEFGHVYLWGFAILFFAIGDLVTTVIGLRIDGVYEQSPIPALLIAIFGVEILLFLKSITVALFVGIWRITPSPYNVGVPVGLVMIGILVTMWNTVTVATAVLLT